MQRHSIPKGVRFEIFKRDKFHCVYCGNGPPLVVLEVDHVVAVAAGGTNDPHNLATSCFDCNSGKSDIPLDRIPKTHEETVALAQEKLDQLRAITKLSLESRSETESLFAQVAVLWPDRVEGDLAVQMRRYLGQLPIGEVMEAVELTNARLSGKPQDERFRYFCGVCNHKVRGEKPDRPSYWR